MTSVAFQDSLCRVAPQTDGVIPSAGQNVLSVRGKLGKAHGWPFRRSQCFDAVSCGEIPNANSSIPTARDELGSVTIEMHTRHGLRVASKSEQAFATLNVPDLDGRVVGARGNKCALGIKIDAKDIVQVSKEHFAFAARCHVPDGH